MMDKKAKLIGEILDHYFPEPPIPLQHKDPYTLLIAVLLSARCTDARVNQITPVLFALADTPQKMIQLSIPQIQSIIRPCGLSPFKSKSIWQLSHDLIHQHNGKVPRSFEALEALPGVGHKTASVVMAQAFNEPAFPIDTHLHRSAKRWHLSNGRSIAQTEKDLKRAFPKETWIKRHLQIIHFARAFCPARSHVVDNCPICTKIRRYSDSKPD
jgi:endonuclease-3